MATITFFINHEHPDWVDYSADIEDLVEGTERTVEEFIALTKSEDADDRDELLEILCDYAGTYGQEFQIGEILQD